MKYMHWKMHEVVPFLMFAHISIQYKIHYNFYIYTNVPSNFWYICGMCITNTESQYFPLISGTNMAQYVTMATTEDICHGVPREKLDSPITDIHIADLAFMLTTWEELAPYLGLTPADEAAILVDYRGRYGLQKRQALRKWQSKLGSGPNGATYRQLIIALCRASEKKMAEKVKELLTKPEKSVTASSDHVLDTFRKYLVDCYTITQPPSTIHWPFSRLSSYIDLTLVQVPDTLMSQSGQGESQTKRQALKEVHLGELFEGGSHQAKRKVVLIEGPAGSGKTTLSWHVCREWAAGRLFQEFPLLIYISLEDRSTHKAECLDDLIPHHSDEVRKAVSSVVSKQDGKGVCFLFDTWDQVPHTLRGNDSFLFQFITGTATKKLPHCSIIAMSRPVAAGLLYPHLTVHVNNRGFQREKLEEFICASLEDSSTKQKLFQQLREKPQVNDLCTLPINAAIVVHLFRCSSYSTLPSTRTGIFKELVSSLLRRHMQLRTDHGLEQWEEEEFEHLPADALQEFKSVCRLAFDGVIKDKNIFFLDSLRQLGLTHPSSPLGLMQAQQQLTGFRPHHHYSFLHYAVQEFLAAYHISKLSEEEQTKAVWQILHSTPLSTVLPFYAGLTRLSNEGACGILLEVTKHPLDTYAVAIVLQHTLHESADRRRLLLALLNCIYEAQKPSICKLVNPPLHPAMIGMLQESGVATDSKLIMGITDLMISLNHLGLDAVDCLSIGYFIHKKCVVSKHLTAVHFDLLGCYIGDTEIEILIKHIRQVPSSGPGVHLQLTYNTMTHRAIKSISDALIQTSALHSINLTGCLHPAVTDINCALKYLIEGVSRNTSLENLDIGDCSLGPAHAYHLALLAAVCNTEQLFPSSNNIGRAIPFIAEAIKHNKAVRMLYLDYCQISDRELLVLGEALQQNDTLTRLNIIKNPFSSNALTLFLKWFIGTNSRLRTVVIFHSLSDEQRRTVNSINILRSYQSAPPLEVTDLAAVYSKVIEARHSVLSALPDIRTRSAFRDSNTN